LAATAAASRYGYAARFPARNLDESHPTMLVAATAD